MSSSVLAYSFCIDCPCLYNFIISHAQLLSSFSTSWLYFLSNYWFRYYFQSFHFLLEAFEMDMETNDESTMDWAQNKWRDTENGCNRKRNKCVSRTDTNPPFAFQTAFPRGTDFSVSTGRVKKLHTLLVSLYF